MNILWISGARFLAVEERDKKYERWGETEWTFSQWTGIKSISMNSTLIYTVVSPSSFWSLSFAGDNRLAHIGLLKKKNTLQRCVICCCRTTWISYPYTYIPFLNFLSIKVATERWEGVPVLCSRFSLVFCSIHGRVSMPVPPSHFPPWRPYIVLFICVSISAFQRRQLSTYNFLGAQFTYREEPFQFW